MSTISFSDILPDVSTSQSSAAGSLRQQVTTAIQTAANRTGVNFAYLLNKAQQESGGDPNAKASNSSATGLFQFTGQTWLKMMKSHGAQYGLGDYADHISVNSDGTASVKDPTWKKAILSLRKDPQISAEMAGELDKENGAALKQSVGGKIGPTELYMAHFLGASGASDFLNTLHSDPSAKAADILPGAASSNSSVFYDANGDARSVSQIYQHFAKKFNSMPGAGATMLASASPAPKATAASVYAQSALGASVTSSVGQASLSASSSSFSTSPYVVADAAAERSAYASTVGGDIKTDSSSLFATMILAQMKKTDMPTASTSAADAYNKKSAVSLLGSVA